MAMNEAVRKSPISYITNMKLFAGSFRQTKTWKYFSKLIILANDKNKIKACVPQIILYYGKCVNFFLEIMASVSLFYA